MTQPTIVFSHGNSFPASTYGVLFAQLRARGFEVVALDKLGHDPHYPVTNNWPHLVQELAVFVQTQVQRSGAAVWLVGHSMGGYVSLMLAAQRPELARGVLLLDAPLVGGWRAMALQLAKHARLTARFPPGVVSRRRRNTWPSVDAVVQHFKSKPAFARWHAQVLQDYAEHGTHDAQGQRVLGFDRAVETRIYNQLPSNIESLLRRHPLRCPVAFIGGTESQEMRQVGMSLTRRVTHGRITLLAGTHLFPMECPIETAAAIEAALGNLPTGTPAD